MVLTGYCQKTRSLKKHKTLSKQHRQEPQEQRDEFFPENINRLMKLLYPQRPPSGHSALEDTVLIIQNINEVCHNIPFTGLNPLSQVPWP